MVIVSHNKYIYPPAKKVELSQRAALTRFSFCIFVSGLANLFPPESRSQRGWHHREAQSPPDLAKLKNYSQIVGLSGI